MSKEKKNNAVQDFYIAGVGTSAGGLEALSQLLGSFNGLAPNLSVVVLQHLSPNFKSELSTILARQCKWPVVVAKQGMELTPHKVFVTPQNKQIFYNKGKLELGELSPNYAHAPSIDDFLVSLAEHERQHAIGIVLSGTGNDGAEGVKAIKENGGFTIAQSPESAQYGDMPLSAIQTDKIDAVLHPTKIFEEITYYIKNHRLVRETTPHQKGIDILFSLLSKRCGVDFSQYKPNTIMRRIEKRLEALHLSDLTSYYHLIQSSPLELDNLFETVLIGVTEFFRDARAFDSLKEHLKKLFEKKKFNDAIRIWSVGCATGQEPYSIAIMMQELMGNKLSAQQLQIFASDIDERALTFARKGIYSGKSVEQLPPDILDKYFEQTGSGYEVKKIIKQYVLFSRHDITNDPPFVKLDLIICRNLLIYFNNYLQKETLRLFNYALKPGGLLFLGKSENVSGTGELFSKINELKLFRKVQATSPANLRFSRCRVKFDPHHDHSHIGSRNMSLVDVAKETLYYSNVNPFVIITEQGEIKESQGSLRLYMEVSQGSMTANIFKMANKELVMEIRSLLARVKKSSLPQSSQLVKFTLFEKDYFVRLHLTPLIYPTSSLQHCLLQFESIDPAESYLQLTKELTPIEYENYRIQELEQEVVSLREHVQVFTEELESSNEKMQAINEELQSANEELKSANEELETSNEELQSSNEELHTANNELRFANNLLIEKEQELKAANKATERNELIYRTMSENIPNGSIGILNDKLQIEYVAGKGLEVFNAKKENLVGIYLPDLNPSIVERKKLKKAFNKALEGKACRVEFNFNDRTYLMHTLPFKYNSGTDKKVMYLSQEITDRKIAEEQIKDSERRFRTLADNIPNLCWMANADGWIYWYNSRWYEYTGKTLEEMQGWGWESVHDPQVLPEVRSKWQEAIARELPFEMVFPLRGADGDFRKFLTRILPIKDENGKVQQWFGTNTDITEREKISEQKDEFIGIASHELKTPVTSVKGFIQIAELMIKDGKFNEIEKFLVKAELQIDKLTGLINDLLNVSKMKAGKLEYNFSEFPVREIIEDCVEQISNYANDHRITVNGDMSTTVYGDKVRLEQVVNNLLTNAVKYSPDEGEVVINITKEQDKLRISVIDTGIGIPKDMHAYLFDRFFRVKQSAHQYQGMGMGLYISSEIVKRHGGKISVKSAENKGSEFSFTIPLKKSPSS